MKKLWLLMIFCLIFALFGCADYREIERGYLVTAIGLSAEKGGATIYIEALSSSDITEKVIDRVVLTSDGESVKEAYKNLKSNLVKPLYFEQLGAAFLENTDVGSLKEIDDIKLDVYIVKTENMKAVFESNTPNGVLGYDVISLIKTQKNGKNPDNQLYKLLSGSQKSPMVDVVDGNLILR